MGRMPRRTYHCPICNKFYVEVLGFTIYKSKAFRKICKVCIDHRAEEVRRWKESSHAIRNRLQTKNA